MSAFPINRADAKGRAAHSEIGSLIVVAEFEGTDAPLAGMRPSRLGDVPVVQRVLCLKGGGELKLVPDNFADRPRTGQRQRVSQAVINQPEFLMLPV